MVQVVKVVKVATEEVVALLFPLVEKVVMVVTVHQVVLLLAAALAVLEATVVPETQRVQEVYLVKLVKAATESV